VSSRALWVITLGLLVFGAFWFLEGAHRPFIAFALMGALLVHAGERPKAREVLICVVLAAGIGLAYLGSGRSFGSYTAAEAVGLLDFLGLASIAMLTADAARDAGKLRPFLIAIFGPLLMSMVSLSLTIGMTLHPRVYDPVLYRFDELLGGQASFVVGRWFSSLEGLQQLCFLAYGAMPLAVVYLCWESLQKRKRPDGVIAMLAAGGTGYVLYQICPASGPTFAFGSAFPFSPPVNVTAQAIPLGAFPRNAMPSVHIAWTLLLMWHLPTRQTLVRLGAFVFLVLTALATLGLGEHYLIDLVLAVPLAASAQAICAASWLPGIAGLALTSAWLWAFRLCWLPSDQASAWLLVLATIGISAIIALASVRRRARAHTAPLTVAVPEPTQSSAQG
jgi:PAP2 superfamily protein